MFNSEILLRISKEAGAPVSRVETTIKLLEDGATVPFIARYRKEWTGNLDEVKIRDIDESRRYYTDLEARRATVLGSIEKQGKLTDELKAKILACYSKNELEYLYLPYKPKRKTKASVALERGLEPLADYIWEQTGQQPVGEFAEQFIIGPSITNRWRNSCQAPRWKRLSKARCTSLPSELRKDRKFESSCGTSWCTKAWFGRKSLRARKTKRPSTRCTTTSRRPSRRFRHTACSRSGAARAKAF